MSNEIQKSVIDRICNLHLEIEKNLKISLNSAIEIGWLLTEQKKNLPHGEFTAWIKLNMPFSDRTARNYMQLYTNRDKLKTESVSDLAGAYKLLTHHKEPLPELTVDDEFSKLMPPMQDLEYVALCKSITKGGWDNHFPIMVWSCDGKKIVIDGHQRYRICKEKKISFNIMEIDFESRDHAAYFILNEHLKRRNMTRDQYVCWEIEMQEFIRINFKDEALSHFGWFMEN